MKTSKEQQSILAITAGLLLVAWLKHNYFCLLIAVIVLFTLPFTSVNTIIHKGWLGLSKILGTISSSVILFILFYFFLTPIAFIRRLTGKKDMMKKFDHKETSSFSSRNHLYDTKDFLNPW
jgi:choline-glycine betaine transporter